MQFSSKPGRLSALTIAVHLATGALLSSPLFFSTAVNAQTLTPAQINQQGQINFVIASGSLSKVLNHYAEQAGMYLTASAELTKAKTSTGLAGSYNRAQALEKILQGTGISFNIKNKTVTLSRDPGKVMTLATTQVNDSTLGSNTEGTGSYTTGSMNSATGLNLSLRDTPQSVSVVTSQLMLDQNLRTLTDVVNNAAGISSKEKDSARHSFSARGFEIESYQIDGIAMSIAPGGEVGETQSDTVIYERIEIVRGATGLLTGAGNPSAAINMVRKRANSKEFTATTAINVGSWDTYGAMLDVSTALSSKGTVRGRVILNYEDSESYVDLAGNKKQTFYAVVDADISNNTLLSVGASYQNNRPTSSTWGGLPTFHSDGSRTDWSRSKTVATQWSKWDTSSTSYFANLSHEFANGWQARVHLNHIDDTSTLELLYLYGTVDKNTGLGLNPWPYNGSSDRKQTDIGLHIDGNYTLFQREHELTVGLTHSDQDIITHNHGFSAEKPIGDFNLWDGSYAKPEWASRETKEDIKTKQSGFYAASRLNITDELKVILGGRVADWQQNGISWGNKLDFGNSGVFIPYAGALYDVHSNHTVYLSYTDIFMPQNNQDVHNNTLAPVKGVNYEVGFKSEFFGGALNTSVALFKIEQDNLALLDVENSVPGKDVYIAAQGATSEGFEVEAVGKLLPGWNVSFSYTQFTAKDAENKDFSTAFPRQLLKLYTSYNFIDLLPHLTLAGGINWQGENYTDVSNPVNEKAERLGQGAYALVSLMARYDITKQLSLQLNVDNLLDKTYYSQIGFFDQLAYGKPRSINLNLSYQF